MTHPLVKLARKKYKCKKDVNKSIFFNTKGTTGKALKFQKESDALVQDIIKYPHAFVLGCLMDSGVKADIAWAIPYKVYTELGTFEIEDLYKVSLEEYENMFSNGEKKWHRYPKRKAEVFYEGVRKIMENEFLNGDASKIWKNRPSSKQVVKRFKDFKGCGDKIATMATNILYRDFGIEFSDLSGIDISADTHVTRVFQRLGLIPRKKLYIIQFLKQEN